MIAILYFLFLPQLLLCDCFPLRADSVGMDLVKKGVTYDAVTGAVKSCLFCKIAQREEPATIVYEDTHFVVFNTIAPATNKHLLITPKKHIQNLSSLSGKTGGNLVRDMIIVGRIALGEDAEGAHYSFHVPPWNSIDHLHLHAIGSPATMTVFNKIKYQEGSYWCANADIIAKDLDKTVDNMINENNGNNVNENTVIVDEEKVKVAWRNAMKNANINENEIKYNKYDNETKEDKTNSKL